MTEAAIENHGEEIRKPEYDHNAVGMILFSELFNAMQGDANATRAFNEAEAEYLKKNGRGIRRDLRYDFTTDKGVKLRARVYRSGVAVYGTTSVNFEELESLRPYKIGVSSTALDFSDETDFTAGDLSNSPEAESGFRAALTHFFVEGN